MTVAPLVLTGPTGLTATLYQGDCLEVLPTLAAGSVDAVVTDPPYSGISGGISFKSTSGVHKVLEDTVTVGDLWGASTEWCFTAWRAAKMAIIVFAGHKDVAEIRAAFPKAKTIALLTWYKRNSAPVLRNVPKYTTEFIWLLEKAPGLEWSRLDSTLLEVPMLQAGCFATERVLQEGNGKAVHPTQKPVAVIAALLTVNPGTVLDPFMGLGTTGVACAQTGRNFVGIEIDPAYFAIAVKRIGDALKQPRLL